MQQRYNHVALNTKTIKPSPGILWEAQRLIDYKNELMMYKGEI